MATFLAKYEIKVNKINTTKTDITGPTIPVQIAFPLKDKKNAGYLKTFFGEVDE